MGFTKEAFRFKQFSVLVSPGVFPVTTDSVLLGSWIKLGQADKILDIGCGSGILSLMAAQKAGVHAHISAIDSDNNSIQCALYNFKQSPWQSKLLADCLEAKKLINTQSKAQGEFQFDHIICNPPFFSDSLLSPSADKNRTRHQQSLNYSLLVKIAGTCLTPNGKISLVLPSVNLDMLIKQMLRVDLILSRALKVRNKMSSKTNRVLVEFSKTENLGIDSELILYDENGMRSEAYSLLTQDFYL